MKKLSLYIFLVLMIFDFGSSAVKKVQNI